MWLTEELQPKIRVNLKYIYIAAQMQVDLMKIWSLTLSIKTCYKAIARPIQISGVICRAT